MPEILDLLKHLLSVGAEIDYNGNVTLYHGTSEEIKNEIEKTKKMIGRFKGGLFFATSPSLIVKEWAKFRSKENPAIIKFKIPIEKLKIDETALETENELHVRIPIKKSGGIVDIEKYIQP